jgi:hypothetical protein
VAAGIVLLLSNFLIIANFTFTALWPLVLVGAGIFILLQGDLGVGGQGRTFGITRGTVESGALEVSAGEIDVHIRDLAREGRLAAGVYAPESRPALEVRDTQTTLRMDRDATPWFAFNDWEIGLARDLPWQVYVSTSLGQLDIQLGDVIVQKAIIATGIGDIRLVAPREAFEPLIVRSGAGNIHIVTTSGVRTIIHVQSAPMLGIHVDAQRYTGLGETSYVSQGGAANEPGVEIFVSGTFGEVYLA